MTSSSADSAAPSDPLRPALRFCLTSSARYNFAIPPLPSSRSIGCGRRGRLGGAGAVRQPLGLALARHRSKMRYESAAGQFGSRSALGGLQKRVGASIHAPLAVTSRASTRCSSQNAPRQQGLFDNCNLTRQFSPLVEAQDRAEPCHVWSGLRAVLKPPSCLEERKVAVKVLRPELSRTPASDTRDPGCPRRLRWGNPCDA